jgi:AraC-like DNA-binding protein
MPTGNKYLIREPIAMAPEDGGFLMSLSSNMGNGPPWGVSRNGSTIMPLMGHPPGAGRGPGGVALRFSDPDEYAASIRAAQVKVTVTEAGRFAAKLVRIDLHRLWMQRFSENLSRVLHLDLVPGRALILFPTQAGSSLMHNGNEVQPAAMIRLSESDSGFQRAAGSSHFGAMSLPTTDMEALGATFGGSDFTPPKEPLVFTPPSAAMDRLQRLHAAAGYLAEHAPEVVANQAAARGLEQALIAAMADCFCTTDGHYSGRGNRHHAAVMRRFETVVRENPDRVIHVPELCSAIAVSIRTLYVCCNEALGMSPHQYLRLRQLNLVRRALRLANPAATTVTEIATAHGFWELGRFAVADRRLFGAAGVRPDPATNRAGSEPFAARAYRGRSSRREQAASSRSPGGGPCHGAGTG